MKYLEQLGKREELIEEADKLMEDYIIIADKLYNEKTSKYTSLIHMDIREDGIYYEYYKDCGDYTAGRSDFFVCREKLEELLTIKKYNL